MSTTVYEKRSSCFESILSQAATVKLKVAAPEFSPKPPPTGVDHRFPQTFHIETGDSYTERENYKDCPWAKKSSFISTLSPKSLELCTENIGSESGSDVISGADADAIFSSPLFSSSSDYSAPNHKGAESDGDSKRRLSSQKRANHSFPPPLTTMSVARPLTLQARRHMDGGRLVIEAVEAPFGNTYLRAERCDGRLRMSFLTAADTAGEEGDEQDGQSATAAAAAEEEEEEGIKEAGNEVGLDQSNEENEIDDNLEMEKYQWLSRCGGNRGLCGNWKPAFWVAT